MVRKSQILKCIFLFLILLLIITLMRNTICGYHFTQDEKKEDTQELEELWAKYNNFKLNHDGRELFTFELVTQMEKKIPNLPLEYHYRHSDKMMQLHENCAQYPAIQVLNLHNTYWQTFHVDNNVYHLYGAYYDERPQTGPVIRILAMSNRQQNEVPVIYCQLWYKDDNRPVLTKVKEHRLIWETNWDVQPPVVYYPYLLTCEVPKNNNIIGDPTPKVVNLVGHQCDMAKNSLRIIYEKPELNERKYGFAVCVKSLDFPYNDLSARLVEWLELLRILGVHKVFLYRLQVQPNISKVLDYYEAKGFVEVRDITLVGGVVGQPRLEHWLIKTYPLNKRLNELIPYNDCFYRNMYKYDYVTLLDFEEIILPKGQLRTWQHLLERVQGNDCGFGHSTLCATNVYFPGKLQDSKDNIKSSFNDYTTSHHYVKCLYSTKQVLTLHNHYPLVNLNTSCPALNLSTSDAQLQHYRSKSGKRDENINRYRNTLIRRCTKVLQDLKFINFGGRVLKPFSLR